jgi:hypothetical protein
MQGVVLWPDGTPVANESVIFTDLNGGGYTVDAATDSSGHYHMDWLGNTDDEVLELSMKVGSDLACQSSPGPELADTNSCSVIFTPSVRDPNTDNPYAALPADGTSVNWQATGNLLGAALPTDWPRAEADAVVAGAATASQAEQWFTTEGQ